MSTKAKDPAASKEPTVASLYEARAQAAGGRTLWVHPVCQPLPTSRKGPFTALADGSLLTVDDAGLSISHDDGRTWSATIPAAHGQGPDEPASCYVMQTAAGTYVMVYLNRKSPRTKFSWNAEKGEPNDDCWLELRAVRSRDGGKTWVDAQTLLDGFNANFFGFIQLRSGRLVLVAEHLLSNPGRWVVCSFVSDDEGQTWRRSNLIDLGGHGHHDGGIEPTVTELRDGRVMMLIRTNLGFFWQAFSTDGGRYWRTIQPSPIDASSAPGQLVRLHSGRLILVWNRRDSEDKAWPLSKPNEQHSEFPASWHREELSIAASEDDGQTWTPPLVIGRLKGGQLSYPQVIERRPGELWVVPGFASKKWFNEEPITVGMKISETDLVRELAKAGR